MTGGRAGEGRAEPRAEILMSNCLPPSVRGEQVAQTRLTLITWTGAPAVSEMLEREVSLDGLKEGRTTPRKGAGGRLDGVTEDGASAVAATHSLLSLGLE